MDAITYLKEKHRMCKTELCVKCKLSSKNNGAEIPCEGYIAKNPEKAVAIVEQWSKENPLKTKKDKFFEMCPNAPKKQNGFPFCGLPRYVGLCNHTSCLDCKHKDKTPQSCWDLSYEGDD